MKVLLAKKGYALITDEGVAGAVGIGKPTPLKRSESNRALSESCRWPLPIFLFVPIAGVVAGMFFGSVRSEAKRGRQRQRDVQGNQGFLVPAYFGRS